MKNTASAFLALSLLASTGFAQAPATTSTTTTTTTTADATAKTDVGVSSRDGITVSGADVIVTRNGASQKLTQEMELSNGTRVMPDGTFMMKDGNKMTLRTSQVLGFDGKIINAPIVESVAPKPPSVLAPSTPAASNPTTLPAPNAASSEEAARMEAQRRANSSNKGSPTAGEGAQK